MGINAETDADSEMQCSFRPLRKLGAWFTPRPQTGIQRKKGMRESDMEEEQEEVKMRHDT